jgi:chromosome segregation ATPase
MSEQQNEIRADVTVVTPENFDAYVNERMGIVEDTPEQVAQKELDAINATNAEAANAKEIDEDPTHDVAELPDEKKKGINERFSKLSTAKREAEAATEAAKAEVKAEKERSAKLEQEANELRAKYEPVKTEQDPEPMPEQFTDLGQYREALKEWTADDTRRKDSIEAAEKSQIQRNNEVTKLWQDRQAATKATIPDYAETIANSELNVSNQIRDAIVESEIGPQVLYHLAKNPDLVAELNSMPVAKALIKFGKLEDKLTPASNESKPTLKVVEVSKAPAPISPLKGSTSVTTNGLDAKGEFHGTAEEWRKLRQSGKIK